MFSSAFLSESEGACDPSRNQLDRQKKLASSQQSLSIGESCCRGTMLRREEQFPKSLGSPC
jgi:hypothetical protein